MPRCAGIKRDGGRCTAIVRPSQTHCYQHDPKRMEGRRRNASKGGWSKGNTEIAHLNLPTACFLWGLFGTRRASESGKRRNTKPVASRSANSESERWGEG